MTKLSLTKLTVVFLIIFAGGRPGFAAAPGCEEAQHACDAWCMKPAPSLNLPANFADLCTAACAKGVSPCQAATDKTAKCNQFLWTCQDACPDVKHDRANNVYTEMSTGRKCLNSCYQGNLQCYDILKP